MTERPLRPEDFYDHHPTGWHAPGDIWSDLPTFGLTREIGSRAVIITPACDLENCKTETITYLPIVSVGAWTRSSAFARYVTPRVNDALRQPPFVSAGMPRLPVVPSPGDLEQLDASLELGVRDNRWTAEVSAGVRNGLAALRMVLQGRALADELADFGGLMPKKRRMETVGKAIGNALPEVHYLPPDEKPVAWTAVPDDSLILFRYPMTVPTAALELALDAELPDWTSAITGISPPCPLRDALASRRPLRRARLRSVFASDMLTRHVALHARVGAPDLPDAQREMIVDRCCRPASTAGEGNSNEGQGR